MLNSHFFNSEKLNLIYTEDCYLRIKLLNSLTKNNNYINDYNFMKPILLKILYTLFLKKVLTSKNTNRIVSHCFKSFHRDIEKEFDSLIDVHVALLDRNYSSSLILNTIYDSLN